MGKRSNGLCLPGDKVGVFIHVFGMYIMQMKGVTAKTTGIAKALWISAWICLLALIAIIIYLFLGKK